jgi:hypothetical protein
MVTWQGQINPNSRDILEFVESRHPDLTGISRYSLLVMHLSIKNNSTKGEKDHLHQRAFGRGLEPFIFLL